MKDLEKSPWIRTKEFFNLRIAGENLTSSWSVRLISVRPEEICSHDSFFFLWYTLTSSFPHSCFYFFVSPLGLLFLWDEERERERERERCGFGKKNGGAILEDGATRGTKRTCTWRCMRETIKPVICSCFNCDRWFS